MALVLPEACRRAILAAMEAHLAAHPEERAVSTGRGYEDGETGPLDAAPGVPPDHSPFNPTGRSAEELLPIAEGVAGVLRGTDDATRAAIRNDLLSRDPFLASLVSDRLPSAAPADGYAYAARLAALPSAERDAELQILAGACPPVHHRVLGVLEVLTGRRWAAGGGGWFTAPDAARPFAWITDENAREAASLLLLNEGARRRALEALPADRRPAVALWLDRHLTEPDCFSASAWGAREVRLADGTVTGHLHNPDGSESVQMVFPSVPSAPADAVNRFTAEHMNEWPIRPPDSLVRLVVEGFERVLRERLDQRLKVGEWASVVGHTGALARLDQSRGHRAGSVMSPGRPLTHVGRADRVWTEPDHRGVLYEFARIEVNGQAYEGRRVLPGANDSPLLLPCAAAGCSRPHVNGSPFCRTCRPGHRAGTADLEQVSRRLHELGAELDRPDLSAEARRALATDADLLNQYVEDGRVRLRREAEEADRRREREVERARLEALAELQKERELLERLMTKHGVRPQKSAEPPPEGERNLEL